MQQLNEHKDFSGKVIFRLFGVCTLVLFLFWNPVVLRPRSWNTSVVARSMALDTALLIAGIGFILLRRWAALLSIALAGYLAFSLASIGGALVAWSLVFLVLLVLAVVFWRTLVWGNKLRDSLFALAGVVTSAIIHYIAFLVRP
jgi:hypothetical protein